MAEVNDGVTCAERVRMNALAGILFVVGGDGIILLAMFSDTSGTLGQTLTGVCGVAAVFIGFYYMLCYLNKAIRVSSEGVLYSNWMGRKSRYDWDQVSVSHHPGRNAYFIFDLNGKKVKFYGYTQNAEALHEYLMEHERYDGDTMRAQRKAAEEREELIRRMQQRSRANGADNDDWDEE